MRWSKVARPVVLAVVLLLALAGGVAVGQDVIVPGGPVGGFAQLWRDFGTYQAQTVSLAPFDEVTGAALVIDTVHHEAHEGEIFHASQVWSSVSNGASVEMAMQVTTTKDAHMTWDVVAGGQVLVQVWESPTYASLGTAVNGLNMNRTFTNTSASTVYAAPTITSTGTTTLTQRILPGGSSPQTRVGGGIRQGSEWVFKPGGGYLVRITNQSGTAVPVNVAAEWYEEDQ